MWPDPYSALAEQRLQELYADAAARRAVPVTPRRLPRSRARLGRALVRWGERLASPVGSSVAHQ